MTSILKLKKLIEVLNNLFKKPVELELIRLHYPYNDSNILARLLGFMINKIKFRRITRKLIRKSIVKNIKKQDEGAKMLLDFTQNCISHTKVSRCAKIVPNLGSRCKYSIFT